MALTGSNHPSWKGDAVSPHGGRRRAQRIYEATGPCEVCGDANSERHHRDENTANNERSNIEFLCRRCHMERDGRLQSFAAQAKDRIAQTTAAAAEARRARTLCKRGHELAGENLYTKPNGSRVCIACRTLARTTTGDAL